MRHRSLIVVFFASLFLTAGVPARALAGPNVDLSGGYSYLHDSTDGSGTNFPVGWFATAGVPITKKVGAIVVIGGYYKSDTTTTFGTQIDESWKIHSFMAGPTVDLHDAPKWNAFGFVAAGVVLDSSSVNSVGSTDTNFGFEPGAGINWKLTRKIGFQVGAGVRFVQYESDTSKQFQLTTGLTYGLGK